MNTPDRVQGLIVDLSETSHIALLHIVSQAEQGLLDGAVALLGDFVEAFAEMEAIAIRNFDVVNEPRFFTLNDALKRSLNLLIKCYEDRDEFRFVFEAKHNLLTVYTEWKQELTEIASDLDY